MTHLDERHDRIKEGQQRAADIRKDRRNGMLQRGKEAAIAGVPLNERPLVVDPVADVHVNVTGNVTGKVDITLGENTHLTVNVSADQSTDDKEPVVQQKTEVEFDIIAHTKRYDSPYTYQTKYAFTRSIRTEEKYYVEVTIPEGVTKLPAYALHECIIIKMNLPTTLKKIGRRCFKNTVFNMPEVTFPESVGTIGEHAFSGASGNHITLPSQVRCLRKKTFYNSRFREIKCLGVEVIMEECFSRININDGDSPCIIHLGEDLAIIKDFAFEHSKIRIPYLSPNVESIGEWCFAESDVKLGVCDYKYSGLSVLKGCTFLNCNIIRIKIPRGVTMVGDGCFANCINLYEVEIPDTVCELGWFCFYHCINLTEINLPSRIRIGSFCFFYCSSLETVRVGGKEMKFEIRYDVFKDAVFWDSVGCYKDPRYPGYPNIAMIPYEGVGTYDTSFSFTNLVNKSLTSADLLKAAPPNHFYNERRDDYLFDFDYIKEAREMKDTADNGSEDTDDNDSEDYSVYEKVTTKLRFGDETTTFFLDRTRMKKNREDPDNLLVQYDDRLKTSDKETDYAYDNTSYEYTFKYRNTRPTDEENSKTIEYTDYNTVFVNRYGARHERIFQAMLDIFAQSIQFGFPFNENSFALGYDKDDYPEDASRTVDLALPQTFN